MLAIRLQRTGRKGYAQYRVIVQEAHRTPTSGRVVAYLGSYDPHAKTVNLKKDDAQKFLDNGAQPSERVAGLLKSEGVKLPKWVKFSDPKERTTRNPEKLRKSQPEKPAEEAPVEAEATAEAAPAEGNAEAAPAPAEEKAEEPVEQKTEEPAAKDEPTDTPADAKEEPAEEKSEDKPAKAK